MVKIFCRKCTKKARVKERRGSAYKAATEYDELRRSARRGYEHFHQLPEGLSPPACHTNSSAGALGWAKYTETIKPMAEKAPEAVTIAAKLIDYIQVPSANLVNILRPESNIDLLTRADAPLGISQEWRPKTKNQDGS